PAEGIGALEAREHALGDERTADAMRAVAAGDVVALDLDRARLVPAMDPRLRGFDAGEPHVAHAEEDLAVRVEAPLDEVLDHFMLRIERHALAREPLEVDAVAAPVEAQLDPLVDRALARHALSGADALQEIRRALLEQARADRAFDLLAAAVLDHH